MNLTFNQIEKIIAAMVKAQEQIDSARNRSSNVEDDKYISYREGVYDTYYEILISFYSPGEIEEMENLSRVNGGKIHGNFE